MTCLCLLSNGDGDRGREGEREILDTHIRNCLELGYAKRIYNIGTSTVFLKEADSERKNFNILNIIIPWSL